MRYCVVLLALWSTVWYCVVLRVLLAGLFVSYHLQRCGSATQRLTVGEGCFSHAALSPPHPSTPPPPTHPPLCRVGKALLLPPTPSLRGCAAVRRVVCPASTPPVRRWAKPLVFALQAFWVPQIAHVAASDGRQPLHPSYVVGMSLARLAVPLYVWGCPRCAGALGCVGVWGGWGVWGG